MIKTYQDYLSYLEADRIAMGRPPKFGIVARLTDGVWRYMRLLRKREYLVNCKPKKGIWRIVRMWNGYWLRRAGSRLGFTIPANTFGEGLYITHVGTIVVNHNARIGKNCVVNVCVNIGNSGSDYEHAPQIGDNCFIGPGAKLFGNITLGDNVKIGANAVVNKSFPEGNCTLVGVPAHKV